VAATSLAEAIEVLADDADAKVIAGGQSLMPLLALRLARPSVLVDITRLTFDHVTYQPLTAPSGDGPLEIGALVRHRRVEHDPLVRRLAPLLADAARHVGYPAIRNRGTLGGSLAHADPVAELPVAVVALEGSVLAEGPDGARDIPAVQLADGFLSTTLDPAEVLTAVRVRPAGPNHGAAFCEWAPRQHDFADAGVGVALELDGDGRVAWLGAAGFGLDSFPVPLADVLAAAGVRDADEPGDLLLRAVAAGVTAAGRGFDDDRRELAGLLAARALRMAWERAASPAQASFGTAA
jgi:carbon-monoxide dehydrogenase medium subunit